MMTAFRREDNDQLQVLVNKVLRLITGLDRDTPVATLTMRSGQLSVHQRTALFTLTSVHKAIRSKEPHYSHSKFKTHHAPPQPVLNQANCSRVEAKLSISRGGFFYRGSSLYNQIPASLANMETQQVFKKAAKEWVGSNIPIYPL